MAPAPPVPNPRDLRLVDRMRNDIGNAERLVERYGADLLYVRDIGWHWWTGTHWSLSEGERQAQLAAHETAKAIFDEAKALELFARQHLAALLPEEGEAPKLFEGRRQALAEELGERIALHRKWAIASGNRARLVAMVSEAQPYRTVTIDDMDCDPMLFNVQNGTILLRKAADGGVELRGHDRNDRITKLAPVTYDAEADASVWRAFTRTVLPDEDVRTFLRRYLGYCLTASVSEQVLVLCHGTGANGKSTLINTALHVMGDYATTLPFASLLHDDRRRGSEPTPDIAQLPGRRMVAASEPEAGTRISESTIKLLTGEDKVKARHLNEGFFEFYPAFKLILSCNRKPTVRGQDEGIWRRVLLVPFEVMIPADKRDPHLQRKLRLELSGILNWILDGFRLWVEDGLQVPSAVSAATAAYRADSDPIGQFLSTATRRTPDARVTAKDLYANYCGWCRVNAVTPLSQTLVGRMLVERGYEKEKSGIITYRGLELIERFAQHDKSGGGDSVADDETPVPSESDYGAE